MSQRASRAATQPRRGLDHDEAAIYVGLSFRLFDQMVEDGRMPQPTIVSGEAVWDLVKLDRAFDKLTGLARNPML
jgi:predicted DNA-binding transcriptional regulator AlpA